jgi:hypothetical protein
MATLFIWVREFHPSLRIYRTDFEGEHDEYSLLEQEDKQWATAVIQMVNFV